MNDFSRPIEDEPKLEVPPRRPTRLRGYDLGFDVWSAEVDKETPDDDVPERMRKFPQLEFSDSVGWPVLQVYDSYPHLIQAFEKITNRLRERFRAEVRQGARCCTSHIEGLNDERNDVALWHTFGDGTRAVMNKCCDPDDCGPCCEFCPTCPSTARMNANAQEE